MARQTFFSFHYKPDCWRASQVRNIGVVDGNSPVSDNDWEAITKKGDAAIQNWIETQMKGRSCTIVLIGANTAGRKWIDYEIKKTWADGKGLVGIYIHNLKDASSEQSSKGANPFDDFKFGDKDFSSVVKAYDPPYSTSIYVYDYIKENIEGWIEEAIKIRSNY
jgi:hypothetical protein